MNVLGLISQLEANTIRCHKTLRERERERDEGNRVMGKGFEVKCPCVNEKKCHTN